MTNEQKKWYNTAAQITFCVESRRCPLLLESLIDSMVSFEKKFLIGTHLLHEDPSSLPIELRTAVWIIATKGKTNIAQLLGLLDCPIWTDKGVQLYWEFKYGILRDFNDG